MMDWYYKKEINVEDVNDLGKGRMAIWNQTDGVKTTMVS